MNSIPYYKIISAAMQAIKRLQPYNLQKVCNEYCAAALALISYLLYNKFRTKYSEVKKIMAQTEKFIAYEKLSKKQRRQADQRKRSGWGLINPVTKVKPSAKIYQRSKTKQDARSYSGTDASCFYMFIKIYASKGYYEW